MKKTAAFVTVAVIGFFSGAYWACFKICQMVDSGEDVNQLARNCMNKAGRDAELVVNKWRRKYSEVHR